ncbi:MAG: hypothetical protein KJ727_08640 [Acidobacteria bacterium]|nr:hypothetical protein [Acidobacteriota bacterium]
MKRLIVLVAGILCLTACLLFAVLIFRGDFSASSGKFLFLLASAGWFVFASTRLMLKNK